MVSEAGTPDLVFLTLDETDGAGDVAVTISNDGTALDRLTGRAAGASFGRLGAGIATRWAKGARRAAHSVIHTRGTLATIVTATSQGAKRQGEGHPGDSQA